MTAMGSMPPSPAESAVVLVDTPCRKCQYNLRSLQIAGRCPECGMPVGLSVMGDLLRYSDPAWLYMLRRGINCIIGAIVVTIIGVIFGALHSQLLAILASMAAAILSYLGAWLLTMPDPSGLGEDKYGTSRKVIRITLMFGIVSQLAQFAQQEISFPADVMMFVQVIVVLAAIASVVGLFATLNYLKKLALRLPDDKIAGRAGFLMYAIGISYGVLAISGLMALLMLHGRVAMGGFGVGLGCVAGIAGLAAVIFGIMYLLMLEKLGKRFKEAEGFARQTWGSVISQT